MRCRFSANIVHFLGLSIFVVSLYANVPQTAQANPSELSRDIISNELLSSPKSYHQRLVALAADSRSTAESLQLAMTQHLLGLNKELQNTLQSLPPEAITQHSNWQIVYNFLLGADALKDAEYEHASLSLSLAKALAQKTNSHRLWVLATQELAFNEALQERFEQAFVLLQEAYLSVQQQQGQFELALVEQTLGGVYSYTDNYDQAHDYYQRALARYQSLQFPSYIAETLLGIATTLRHQEKWDNALQAYENYYLALNFQESLGNAFYYHYGKGITLALSGRCVEAAIAIDAAVEAQGPQDYLGELYKKQAICAVQNRLISEAELALDNARTIINQTPELADTLWHTELLLIESDIARASGQLEKALDLYHQYHINTLRLQARKSSSSLQGLQSTLESERKDTQIQQLKQQAEFQSLQLIAKESQEHRGFLIIGCAVLVLILLIGFILFQRHKTQLLYDLATHDPLTNLFNRRHAITMIEHWLDHQRTTKHSFSVLMIDIDHFKVVNDTYGHVVGDKLLVAIAKASSTTLRPSDVLARFGGEEFICILPRTTTDEAEEIGQRIRKQVEKTKIRLKSGEFLNKTVSIGITHVNSQDTDINTVLERADNAMYQAKKAGRNQICVH